jgi:hypothetical protein
MEAEQATWQVLESGVDYWSGTTDDYRKGDLAYERAREYVENDRLGDLSSAGQSISGYVGVASDHTFTGQSERGTFVRVSSVAARERWLDFISIGLRTTRLDVCVTCQSDRDVPSLAYAIRYGPRLPTRNRGKPAGVEFYSKEPSGDTAYIGSARSNLRGRVYDKSAESKGAYPPNCWRWEVQLRHEPSDHIGRHLAARDRHAEWIGTYVRDWYVDRGIFAPWSAEEPSTGLFLARVGTNDAGRLRWLKTSVAPMVERMKNRYTIRELRSALGLLY